MKTYLITGCAGFIGSHLTQRILQFGDQVIGIDNLSSGSLDNLVHVMRHPHFEFIRGDIIQQDLYKQIDIPIDYVLHHAAKISTADSMDHPDLYHQVNVSGFMQVLLFSIQKEVKRFVYATSSAVFGDSEETPLTEETPCNPVSFYALTKQTNEKYAHYFTEHHQVPTIGLRYFNVFGPNQNPDSEYAAVIPKFIRLLKENKPPEIYGDGNQTRDFVFIEDVIQANLKACQADTINLGHVFNIGNGIGTSINELTEKIIQVSGKTIQPKYSAKRAGDVLHSCACIDKATKMLGYTPQYSLEEALQLTYDAYQE